MTAGTWAVEETMLLLASVDVITTFVEAVAAAVRRLLDKTTWPCGLVEEATIGMIAAMPVEVVVIPCAFVAVIAVGRNAIGETGWLAATGVRLNDLVVTVSPLESVVNIATGTSAAMRLAPPWASLEITAPGSIVIGALGIKGEKLVDTTVCPPICVEVCKTGIAATGAVETRMLPCVFVEVTAIGTIVAEGGGGGLAAGRLLGAD